MELFLTVIAVGALVYLTYRAMLNTKELSETKIEAPAPMDPVVTQQTAAAEQTKAKKPRKPRAKKSA